MVAGLGDWRHDDDESVVGWGCWAVGGMGVDECNRFGVEWVLAD